MADSRDADELFWVEPRQRAILPLGDFHMSRSLRRTLRADRFTVTADRDFAGVVAACADRQETWINREIETAVLELNRAGYARSIEVWSDGKLVGGLYGVNLGRAFFGESMFSRATDASKVALAWLVARLKAGGFTLLDCQFVTEHLASLGVISVSRDDYMALLSAATGVEGGGSAAGSALAVGSGGADFFALDGMLDAGAAGAGGPGGYVISQLLGQTS